MRTLTDGTDMPWHRGLAVDGEERETLDASGLERRSWVCLPVRSTMQGVTLGLLKPVGLGQLAVALGSVLLAGVAVLGVSGMVWFQEAVREERVAAVRAGIERDLTLEVTTLEPKAIPPGGRLFVGLKLKNHGQGHSHEVPLPVSPILADGHEPYVHYTLERHSGDGIWRSVESMPQVPDCGVRVRSPMLDVRWLAPAAEVVLSPWFTQPEGLDLGQPGRFRLTVHYRYPGGAGRDADPEGRLAAVPDFEIASNPVEFEVRSPVELVLRRVSRVPSANPAGESGAYEVVLINRTQEPVVFGGGLKVWCSVAGMSQANQGPATLGGTTVPAGGEVSLLRGAEAALPGALAKGPVKGRAGFAGKLGASQELMVQNSEWVTMER